jgi:hypothetical protein
VNLLMKYALLDNKFWALNGTSCIELNNAWIGFEIKEDGNPDHQIKFKDSMRMLPMGLEKLCKELKVEHQKLTETVSHDDITLENYHTFPALRKYLSHDCRGLLEVMLSFNKEVFDALAIDVTTCFTGASLSKQTFFRNYYKFFGRNARPVFSLSSAHDTFGMGTSGVVSSVSKWGASQVHTTTISPVCIRIVDASTCRTVSPRKSRFSGRVRLTLISSGSSSAVPARKTKKQYRSTPCCKTTA